MSLFSELTFTAPHPVTFTITPLVSSFSASFTGWILSLNLISPSTWNEISRACKSYWCCYCQLVQAVSTQREKDTHIHKEERKGDERQFSITYFEKSNIVIVRQVIVRLMSNDLFNWIIDTLVFVVTSCMESVNAAR